MPTQFDPNNIQWIDADTFEYEGDRFRVKGYDAPEKSGIFVDQEGTVRSKAGQVGGAESATAIQKLFLSGGFDRFEDTGELSEGRRVVDLYNSQGDTLTGAAYRSGIIAPNLFTDEQGVKESQAAGLREELRGKREFEDAYSAVEESKQRPQAIKSTVANEKEYRDGLVQVVALEQGLDLSNPEDYVRALNAVQDGDFDRDFNPFSGVDFRSYDRSITNVADRQIAESWRTGWRGMLAGIAGFGEAVGVLSENENIQDWGELKTKQWADAFEEAPDLKNVDWKDIDGVWDGIQWFANNTALSAPYLAVIAGGALASPLTGGLSGALAFSSLSASYSGQVWEQMEGERGKLQAGAALAAGLAMAVVDRIGFGQLIKPSQLLTKEGREIAIQAIAAKQGTSVDSARKLLNEITKKETKNLLKGLGNFASANIAKAGLRDAGKAVGAGVFGEGVTEAIQEGIGYGTAVGVSDKNFNQKEFNDLLLSSAITGGALGGGFSGAGRAYEAGQDYAFRRDLEKSDSSFLNDYSKIAFDIGRQGHVTDIIAENKAATANVKLDRDAAHAARLAQEGKLNRSVVSSTSISEGLKKLASRVPELYRASATTAFRPEVLQKSATARKLYALVGQPLGKLYSGRDVEAYKDELRSQGLSILAPKQILSDFGFSGRLGNFRKVSELVREYTALGGATVRKQDLPPHLRDNKEALDNAIARFKAYSDWDYQVKNETNKGEGLSKDGKPREDLGKIDNWWLTHQNWDWKKVRQYRDEWFEFMRKHTTKSPDEIQELYNKLTNAENKADFSLVEGIAWKPGSLKGRDDKVSDIPGFEKFANTSILENLVAEAEATSSYAAYTEYFGEGGKDLDHMFKQMEKEGLTREELTNMASHVKDIIDAGTGNYEPIKNPKVAKFSRMVASYTSTIGLTFSALASIPEFAMLLYNARNGGDLKHAWDAATEVTKESIGIWKNVLDADDPLQGQVPRANRGNPPSQQLLNQAGIFNDDASIATRYGLAETDVTWAYALQKFFQFTGITAITQAQRRMAAAAAQGFISDRIKILAARPDDAPMNRLQQDLYVQLQDIGMDVDAMVNLYKKYDDPAMFDRLSPERRDPADAEAQADMSLIDEEMNTALYYFVNERIQNPRAYNRPLLFQDPHFQLLTQFNGFTSTFMANRAPKLWNDYLVKGTPTVKYNTFALMVMMVGLAGASQWLRDYAKFGQSTPYLSETQLIQRAFQASGLLGTSERVVQAAFPLYEERGQGLSGKIFGESVGAAPAWRALESFGGLVGGLREGQTERAVREGTKLIPGLGPITPIRNIASQLIHGENLNPYPNRGN